MNNSGGFDGDEILMNPYEYETKRLPYIKGRDEEDDAVEKIYSSDDDVERLDWSDNDIGYIVGHLEDVEEPTVNEDSISPKKEELNYTMTIMRGVMVDEDVFTSNGEIVQSEDDGQQVVDIEEGSHIIEGELSGEEPVTYVLYVSGPAMEDSEEKAQEEIQDHEDELQKI